jgi:hypothetical protein
MDDQREQYSNEGEFACGQERTEPCEPKECYEIRCQGHLGEHWTNWFEGLSMTNEEDGTTTLTGPVADQPALFGLLNKVRDLGVALISVRKVDPSEESS